MDYDGLFRVRLDSATVWELQIPGTLALEPQVLRLRLSQKTRQTSLRMTEYWI
jgi:hypothetical protein